MRLVDGCISQTQQGLVLPVISTMCDRADEPDLNSLVLTTDLARVLIPSLIKEEFSLKWIEQLHTIVTFSRVSSAFWGNIK